MKITEETMRQERLKKDNAAYPAGDSAASPQVSGPRQEEPKPTERDKLKQMKRSDRIWYIWTYYKFHIFAAVLVLVLIQVIASSLYHRSFKTALHCICVNSRSETGIDADPLEKDFASWLGLGKKETIIMETAFISYDNAANNYSYANMAKISALVSTRDLDILICDTENLDHYAELDGFMDLEQGLSPEMLSLVQDRLYYCPGPDGSPHAYAVDISGTEFASRSRLTQTPPLFGIISNSERIQNTEALIRYIFAS